MPDAISDVELRANHEFVMAFEMLRKRYGYREMSDAALRDIAEDTGVRFEELRIARHLRNALAHGEPVNTDQRASSLRILRRALSPVTELAPSGPSPEPTTEGVRAYRIHAWQDPRLEQEMLANGFISVGGSEIGDLTDVHDPEIIRDRLTRSMPDRSPRAIALYVGYWRRFLWDAQPGDLVVLPTRDRRVAFSEFTGPYHYVDVPEPRARHRRPVFWATTGISRDAFGPDLLKVLNGQHTVQEFTAPGAVERLQGLASTGHDPGPTDG